MSKNPTYDEFIETSMRILCNAVMTGGFVELRKAFKYDVMQWIHTIYSTGGFKKEK
jgi:hypothetical protein